MVAAVRGFAYVGIDVAADEQIEVAVAIIVQPGGTAAPGTGGHGGAGGDIREGPVALIAIELIAAVAGDVDVEEAVVIVVAHGDTGGEHAIAGETGFGRYIFEFPVAQVAVEGVAGGRLAVSQVGSVSEEQVGEAVVVEVDDADAGAEGLEHVLFGGSPVFVAEGDA